MVCCGVGTVKYGMEQYSMVVLTGLKISVTDSFDKISGVFGLGSVLFEMMSGGLGFSLW